MKRSIVVVALILLGAAVGNQAYAEQRAIAEIRPTSESSSVSGRLELTVEETGLRVRGRIEGLRPGAKHGFHVHEYGDCSDTGKAAGGHYNPHDAPHGDVVQSGLESAHAGDLGNLEAGPDGVASVDVTVPGLDLIVGAHPVAGRAFIVHEKEDDFGQPLGNAGGRIGCGCIVLSAPEAPPAA
ncbi:MAG: hypothetical protein MOGMAGMI_00523 [Candidatus Omnitrophica bacterium]|nr:hypothetical protein [Candidatus Omnitrophota bacterium]